MKGRKGGAVGQLRCVVVVLVVVDVEDLQLARIETLVNGVGVFVGFHL